MRTRASGMSARGNGVRDAGIGDIAVGGGEAVFVNPFQPLSSSLSQGAPPAQSPTAGTAPAAPC